MLVTIEMVTRWEPLSLGRTVALSQLWPEKKDGAIGDLPERNRDCRWCRFLRHMLLDR